MADTAQEISSGVEGGMEFQHVGIDTSPNSNGKEAALASLFDAIERTRQIKRIASGDFAQFDPELSDDLWKLADGLGTTIERYLDSAQAAN